MLRSIVRLAALILFLSAAVALRPKDAGAGPKRIPAAGEGLFPTEKLEGTGVWVDPRFESAFERATRIRATI